MTNTYRAPNEYAFAAFLDLLHVGYLYEALEPDISRAIRYQPDFWLIDAAAWLEIKPQGHTPTPGEIRVARQLAAATHCAVYIAAGWPQPVKLRVWVYVENFEGEQTAADRAALAWLAVLLTRRLPDVLAASRAVMARRWEFVKRWKAGRA